jgi:hypothetical protein
MTGLIVRLLLLRLDDVSKFINQVDALLPLRSLSVTFSFSGSSTISIPNLSLS